MSSRLRAPLMLVPAEGKADSERPGSLGIDDSALLTGLKERDTALSGAFYDRVRPIVDRTLRRLLGTRDQEYEDIAQRALFQLVDTIDNFRGDCPLDAWVSLVSARVAFRSIRRRRVERRVFAPTQLDEVPSVTRSHGPSVAARQALERVKHELEEMDPTRAWTFLLHDVYGYDLKEVSQITGASLSAAQSRLVRGRRELHERIRQDEVLARFLRQAEEE